MVFAVCQDVDELYIGWTASPTKAAADNCLPIYLDITQEARYDVGYQITEGVVKCK